MNVDTFASFAKRIDTFADGLRDPELRAVMGKVGEGAQGDADKAVRDDLGDDEFSGWPGALLATQVEHKGEGKIEVAPTPRGRGPFRVAQDGRNQNEAGLRTNARGQLQRRSGSRLRKRDGVRVEKWKRTRWNGRTAPMHTWDDAEQLIDRNTARRVELEVQKALGRTFGYF